MTRPGFLLRFALIEGLVVLVIRGCQPTPEDIAKQARERAALVRLVKCMGEEQAFVPADAPPAGGWVTWTDDAGLHERGLLDDAATEPPLRLERSGTTIRTVRAAPVPKETP